MSDPHGGTAWTTSDDPREPVERVQRRCGVCATNPPSEERTGFVREHRQRVEGLVAANDLAGAATVLRCAVDTCHDVADRTTDAGVELRLTLGEVLLEAGAYRDAEAELSALYDDLRGEHGGEPHRLIGHVANTLGVVCKSAGRLDGAERYYRAALVLFPEDTHPNEIASLLHNLADLSHARGDLAGGLEYARHGLELRRDLHGDEHPLVASDRSNLAGLLYAVGDLDEAAHQLVVALRVFREFFGDSHPEVAVCLSGLASIDADRRLMSAAEYGYREAIDIKRTNFGAKHPDTLVTYYNLARLLADTGARTEASELVAEVIDGLAGAVADEHTVLRKARELYASLSVA